MNENLIYKIKSKEEFESFITENEFILLYFSSKG